MKANDPAPVAPAGGACRQPAKLGKTSTMQTAHRPLLGIRVANFILSTITIAHLAPAKL
jgi:hypothetical protein